MEALSLDSPTHMKMPDKDDVHLFTNNTNEICDTVDNVYIVADRLNERVEQG